MDFTRFSERKRWDPQRKPDTGYLEGVSTECMYTSANSGLPHPKSSVLQEETGKLSSPAKGEARTICITEYRPSTGHQWSPHPQVWSKMIFKTINESSAFVR